ncbi:hypothetical protein [Tenacibaculum soleae]|uniref:Uncharacterized protein n=1 Tax=Tenacibaculum soleae TaxID=447689 RepID=A0A1B9XXG7_9FLAO|nr:hypothetical protein [Tenacibaculum soleae]MDO6812468.1 hypothetical protein [Tenacibaculum soleae]OCK42258.1 hypothetical protein BA195_11580 [Tenacibaculum soleae]
MKKIIFIAILLRQIMVSAQNWSFESGGNVFDGKYKTSSIKGKGTDFPYNNPLLVINLFKNESLNFYIADAGYFQNLSETNVLWIFNDELDTLYKSVNISKSDNNKIIFFNDFINTKSNESISKLEFIEKLKTANKVNVRIKDNYGKNDISFSLRASTKAINYVITKAYKEKVLAEQKEVKKLIEEEKNKKIAEVNRIKKLKEQEKRKKLDKQNKINNKTIELLSSYDLDDSEKKVIIKEVTSVIQSYSIDINNIKKININIPLEGTTTLVLLYKYNKFIAEKNIDIPNYRKKILDALEKKGFNRMLSLLSKYDFSDIEIDRILKKINKKQFQEIENKKIISIKFEYLSYATKIKLNNKGESVIISFFDKPFSKQIKKKTRRVKNN